MAGILSAGRSQRSGGSLWSRRRLCFLTWLLENRTEYPVPVWRRPLQLGEDHQVHYTIHRLFQLPVEHDGKSAKYWSLSKPAQKVMKTTLRNVKFIIVDEVSMVSNLNFAYMHLRLNELFGGDDWFGSKNMLFMGDLLQVQPFNGSAVFERITPVQTGLCSLSEHLERRN